MGTNMDKQREGGSMEDPKQAESLQEQFNKLQKEMVSRAMKLGFTDPSVIEISQELDGVHNQMLRIRV